MMISKVAAENLTRKPYINWAVKRVARSLQVLWPRSRTNIFGSYATGLSLPTSDVDLVVSLPPVRNLVRTIQSNYLCCFTSCGTSIICRKHPDELPLSRNPLKKLGFWRDAMVSKKHASRYAAIAKATIILVGKLFRNSWFNLYRVWQAYEQSSDWFISSIGQPKLAASWRRSRAVWSVGYPQDSRFSANGQIY